MENETCIAASNSEGFHCVLDGSGGMAPEGTPCEFVNVCNPGPMCANPDFYPNLDCEGSLVGPRAHDALAELAAWRETHQR